MADVKVALQEIKEDSESAAAAAAVVPRNRGGRRLAALVGTVIVLAGAAAWLVRPRPARNARRCAWCRSRRLKGVEDDPEFFSRW